MKKGYRALQILTLAAISCVLALGMTNPAEAAKPSLKRLSHVKLPNLVIKKAKLTLGRVCKPYKPVIYAHAWVKNIGIGTSPAKLNLGIVGAKDTDGSGWGNGKGLPSLVPGQMVKVIIPIYYLISNPGHMPGWHKFKLQVNQGHWIVESNYNDNYGGVHKILVPKGFCKPRGKLPDLVVTLANLNSGTIKVKNIGAAPAGANKFAMSCNRVGFIGPGPECPEHPGLAAYTDAAFPNKLVINVPVLNPGQVFVHTIPFWKQFKWVKGKYVFKGLVDAAFVVSESNEGNNTDIKTLLK